MNNADPIEKKTEFYSFKHDILADQNNEKCFIQKTNSFYSFKCLKIFMVHKGYHSQMEIKSHCVLRNEKMIYSIEC